MRFSMTHASKVFVRRERLPCSQCVYMAGQKSFGLVIDIQSHHRCEGMRHLLRNKMRVVVGQPKHNSLPAWKLEDLGLKGCEHALTLPLRNVCLMEREIYFKSHISLWEHSSHFRLIGRGVPSVSVVSQLMYKFLCLASPKENP